MMATTLPHSSAVQDAVESYLDELRAEFEGLITKVRRSGEFRAVFRSVWATDEVLRGLSSREFPKLSSARSIIRRTPVLVASGQLDAASMELRRFIEIVLWTVYFTDHRVEWKELSANPVRGFHEGIDQPISFCAHRNRVFYANYAAELLRNEPSGIALESTRRLAVLGIELNAFMHPGDSLKGGKKMRVACDKLDAAKVAKYAQVHRDVCSNAVIVLGALLVNAFDNLSANQREWFDWLIGRESRKKIRSGHFGLKNYK